MTEFISVVDPDNWAGTDYTSLTSWEASNQVDLTASNTKVFSHSGITGVIADGAAVSGGGITSATVVHATDTQILLKSIVGTFSSPAQIQVDGSNYVTGSDNGDSAISIAKGRAGSGVPDVTAVTIDGWTTSATSYIKIWTDPAENHRHKGTWASGGYGLEVATTGNVLNIVEKDVRVEGLRISVTASSGSPNGIRVDYSSGSADVRISHNIIRGILSGTATNSEGVIIAGSASGIVKVYNNIVYDYDFPGNSKGIESINVTTTTYVYNNTVYNNSNGIYTVAGGIVAKNNIVVGSDVNDAYVGTFAAGTTSNATDGTDNIGVGTNRTSQTFTFVDEANDDFHLAVGDGGAKDFGVNLSGDGNLPFTTDVDLVTRSAPWDIGADEYNVIPTLDSVTVSTINALDDTITLTFSEAMDTSTIAAGIGTLVIKYDDDGAGTNEVVIPTLNATVVWSGGDTIATITLDGS